jgi:hypothetical protein
LTIDWINGTKKIRNWVEDNGEIGELLALEQLGLDDFLKAREDVLLY